MSYSYPPILLNVFYLTSNKKIYHHALGGLQEAIYIVVTASCSFFCEFLKCAIKFHLGCAEKNIYIQRDGGD